MPNASTAMLDALLSRGTYLERFTRDQLRVILPIIEAAHDEVLGRIAKTQGVYSKQWLDEMAADLDSIYNAAAAKAYGEVSPRLNELATNEGEWVKAEATQIAMGLSLTTPSPFLFSAILDLPTSIGGSTLDQLFQALAINSREAVYHAISVGMVEGDTVGDMTRRIRGSVVRRASWRKDSEGKRRYVAGQYTGGAVEGVSTRQAEALARTAVMHVANNARDIFYSQNEDIIKGYQYVATLDLRTCVVCGAADGVVFKMDEGKPSLPQHPDCRCLYVPVLKSWKELGMDGEELPEGTRASMDGQVAESVTFADKLAKMTTKQQNEALGPGRAALFRQGVPLADMVENGKALTLKELKGGK